MSNKEVVVTVEADGSVVIDAIGFAGVGCKAATKELEMVLAGGGSVDTKPKPDFFATNPGTNRTTG